MRCLCPNLARGGSVLLEGVPVRTQRKSSKHFISTVAPPRAVQHRWRYLPSVCGECRVRKRQDFVLQPGGRPCPEPSRRNATSLLIDCSLSGHEDCARRAYCLLKVLWYDRGCGSRFAWPQIAQKRMAAMSRSGHGEDDDDDDYHHHDGNDDIAR